MYYGMAPAGTLLNMQMMKTQTKAGDLGFERLLYVKWERRLPRTNPHFLLKP